MLQVKSASHNDQLALEQQPNTYVRAVSPTQRHTHAPMQSAHVAVSAEPTTQTATIFIIP